MIPLQRLFALMCLSLLAACGGGGDDTPPRPVANAGADQTVERGDSVTLDGSGSRTSRDGATLTYTWQLVGKPEGSAATLNSTTAQKPSFDTDLPGTYEADLVVNDGAESSDHDRVIVTATNPDPVAIVKQTTHNVLIGATVSLDASGSLPPTGGDAGALVYEWTLTEKPAGSGATLASNVGAIATLYTEVVGTYKATLVVRYNDKVTAPVTVTVTASNANTKPVANPGGPYTIERGKTLTLDGTGSSDADGNTLSYRWYLFGPTEASGTATVWTRNGSALMADNAIVDYDKAKASITPDVVGSWIVYLVVHDGTSISDFKSANITVTLPAGAANTPPVASTWGTPRVAYIDPVYISENELGAVVWASGNSWDVDGDAVTRRFRWISTPAGFTQNDVSTATSFSFTPTVPGDYSWEMIVNDGKVDSEPVVATRTARTGANRAPSAAVKVDSQTILMGNEAWFDGTTSSDPDLDALTYHWKLIDRPDGSTAVLQPQNAIRADGTTLVGARAKVVTDKPGIYLAALVVKDSHGVTGALNTLSYGRVLVKQTNNAPSIGRIDNGNGRVLRSTNTHFNDSDQPYVIGGEPVTLYMYDPVDPDLDTLYALWTLEQPAGSTLPDAHSTTLAINGATRQFTPGKPVVAGTYTATAIVSDGVDSSEPHSLSFKAVARENHPSLLLEDLYSSTINSWDLSITSGFVGTGAGTEPRQRAFPYWDHADNSFPTRSYMLVAGDNVVKNYRLTAYGGDYTITNLNVGTSTNAAYPGYSGKFSGLTDGQLIKKGETVDFSLVIVAPGGQGITATDNNLLEGITYTFGIAGKPNWSFEYQPSSY